MPARKRSENAQFMAEKLAHPGEVEAQAAEFDQDDQELEDRERKDEQEDEDFQPSSQQTESSSGFQSSQDSNVSAEGEMPESINYRRAVKRADSEAEYIYSSQGSQSSEGWSGDSYSDQEEEQEQEVPPQGTKTPLFLPSSPGSLLY